MSRLSLPALLTGLDLETEENKPSMPPLASEEGITAGGGWALLPLLLPTAASTAGRTLTAAQQLHVAAVTQLAIARAAPFLQRPASPEPYEPLELSIEHSVVLSMEP